MKNICSNCEVENNQDSKYCSQCGHLLFTVEDGDLKKVHKQLLETKPKRKLGVKEIIVMVGSFFITFIITQYLFKPSIDKQLVEVASEINKNCPMYLDEYTVLKNTLALPNKTLQYNYTLVHVTKEEVELDTIKKYVFPSILENVKTNPDLKYMRDHEVTLSYYYTDKKGEYVTQYIVKPEMYEN